MIYSLARLDFLVIDLDTNAIEIIGLGRIGRCRKEFNPSRNNLLEKEPAKAKGVGCSVVVDCLLEIEEVAIAEAGASIGECKIVVENHSICSGIGESEPDPFTERSLVFTEDGKFSGMADNPLSEQFPNANYEGLPAPFRVVIYDCRMEQSLDRLTHGSSLWQTRRVGKALPLRGFCYGERNVIIFAL